jgi:hypothetical protein
MAHLTRGAVLVFVLFAIAGSAALLLMLNPSHRSERPAGKPSPSATRSATPAEAKPSGRSEKSEPQGDPQALLAEIRRHRVNADAAPDDHHRAEEWMQVQDAADHFVRALPSTKGSHCGDASSADVAADCPGTDLVKEASGLGISIPYCGSRESWLETVSGYQQYLKFWPNGPDADQAYWKVMVEPPCCDDCAASLSDTPGKYTPAELRQRIAAYSAFVKRFPASSLRSDAEAKINRYKDLLSQAAASN